MKKFSEVLIEHTDGTAHRQYNRMDGLTHTQGSFRGSIRHLEMPKPWHEQGDKLISQHDHKGRSHEFSYKATRNGKDVHAHVKFGNHPATPDTFPSKNEIMDHIKKQNPHLGSSGHAYIMADRIHKEHKDM